MPETKVVVNCTNCGESTEVPEKFAGHFEGDTADGVCEDCQDGREMVPPSDANKNGYEQVMHDQRGEYNE